MVLELQYTLKKKVKNVIFTTFKKLKIGAKIAVMSDSVYFSRLLSFLPASKRTSNN
jgi:hypothetical protein